MDEKRESPSHQPGSRQGQDITEEEVGREDTGVTETGRPTGTATGRFSTGINADAENPIDPDSPEMPPP